MRKAELKIFLSKLEGFRQPKPHLEQYKTPPDVAAEMLMRAKHIGGKKIVDLGAGTGILTIGAAILGFEAKGYEKDSEALETAKKNLEKAEEKYGELSADFVESEVSEAEGKGDIVVMNPPFGIQKEDSNLKFLEKAFEISSKVLSLMHRSENRLTRTRKFIKEFAQKRGFDTEIVGSYRLGLPNSMKFHEKDKKAIKVDLYYFKGE
ncbi:MAG: METTL5 family protein [Candidatus Nanohaloarchaeota archaeon QJJ-9]|nr:METTL5 family protein [Candidatus Nanohaloarchaeota archaeon QJJ-9]